MKTRPILLSAAALILYPQQAWAQLPDPDERAAATEAQMTDAERFQLLHSLMTLAMGPDRPGVPGIEAMAGYVPGIARLGIPPLYETDASLGVTNPLQMRKDEVSTALPAGLALAASFNPDLAYAGGKMVGAEARAKGFNVLLGGGANLARDPRNGRNFEYLGEDPLLAGIMAGEAVRGTQSERVVSTVKHFALNDQETLRQSVNAVIDEGAFRMSDLLAFELAIERGQPGSVMCAYNRVNGPWACGSDFLLNQVLKRDWGYRGWVMSDWGAAHDVNYAALGLDQQSGAQLDKQLWFDKPLQAEVAAGRIPKARISDMVRRILRSLYAVGADAPPAKGPIDYDAHAQIAYRVATEGIVVLKNEDVLPIARDAGDILVVGGHADLGVLSGGGSSQVTPPGGPAALIPVGGSGGMGPFNRQLFMPSSPLTALRQALPKAKVTFASGYDAASAAALARSAGLVVVFATQWQVEGQDAGSMRLPQGQDELIEAMAATNRNVVVVLETGNPVRMPWLGQVKGVIAAWYPGQKGGEAIADVLTGRVNPSGRLPITFPLDESQLPRPQIPGLGAPDNTQIDVPHVEGADVGYRWFAREARKPLFAFGHGLSYTSFESGDLKVEPGDRPQATFTVRNTGRRTGADVPQLYLTGIGNRSVLRLVGFKKVPLDQGQSKTIRLEIDPRLLADWSNGGWHIPAGQYRFALGKSAADLGAETSVQIAERQLDARGR